jgi:hypothetical protein
MLGSPLPFSEETIMATDALTSHARHETSASERLWLGQLGWFAGGAVLGFGIPFIFSSLLELQHDLYYLIYFTAAIGFLAIYVARHDVDIVAFFTRWWPVSLGLGAVVAGFLAFNVLSRDATAHPDGAYFVFEIFWRGLTYGIVDALLLTAFPALIALALLRDNLDGIGRKARFALITLLLSLIITGSYHLGYEQFREDGVGQPEFGNAVISIPTLVSANPAGSVLAHAVMHVTAVTHAYETEVFLPPQADAE